MLGVLGDSCLVVMNLVFAGEPHVLSCSIAQYVLHMCLVFAVVRTYAMWNKDRRVFVLLVVGLIYPLGSIVSPASRFPYTNIHKSSLLLYSVCGHSRSIPRFFVSDGWL